MALCCLQDAYFFCSVSPIAIVVCLILSKHPKGTYSLWFICDFSVTVKFIYMREKWYLDCTVAFIFTLHYISPPFNA